MYKTLNISWYLYNWYSRILLVHIVNKIFVWHLLYFLFQDIRCLWIQVHRPQEVYGSLNVTDYNFAFSIWRLTAFYGHLHWRRLQVRERTVIGSGSRFNCQRFDIKTLSAADSLCYTLATIEVNGLKNEWITKNTGSIISTNRWFDAQVGHNLCYSPRVHLPVFYFNDTFIP